MSIKLQLVFLTLLYTCKVSDGTANHTKLLKFLLDKQRYSPDIRPVAKNSDIVQINIRITLYQIRELDEKNQYLITNVWIRFFWKDAFLTWKPQDYGGITSMKMRSSKIWQPDIVLYNSVDTELIARDFMADTNAEVSHNGEVSWTAPALLKSSCGIEIGDYPFDVQRCKLKFGSWTFHGLEINVTSYVDYIFLDQFIPDGEWDVTEAPCKRNEVYYSCCPEPYPDITCTVRLRRRPLFYVYNLIFPCILLIVIGGLVFFLPAASGERISLAVTLLLAMTVFMLVIMENIPETSETVPSLEEFIGATIVLLALATITSIFVVNFHHQGESGKKPPKWVRNLVFKFAAKILFVKVPDRVLELDKPPSENRNEIPLLKTNKLLADHENKRNGAPDMSDKDEHNESGSERKLMPSEDNSRVSTLDGAKPPLEMLDMLRAIYYKLSSMRRMMDVKDDEQLEQERVMEQWTLVAAVTDRFFLLVFVLVTVVIMIKVFA